MPSHERHGISNPRHIDCLFVCLIYFHANNKENIKDPHYWSLMKVIQRRPSFSCDVVIMKIAIFHRWFHTCQFTLDISDSPLKINGAPGNIQGNLTGMWFMWCAHGNPLSTPVNKTFSACSFRILVRHSPRLRMICVRIKHEFSVVLQHSLGQKFIII